MKYARGLDASNVLAAINDFFNEEFSFSGKLSDFNFVNFGLTSFTTFVDFGLPFFTDLDFGLDLIGLLLTFVDFGLLTIFINC